MNLISATADLNINGNPQIYVNGNIVTLATGVTNVNVVFDINAELTAVENFPDFIEFWAATTSNTTAGLTYVINYANRTLTITGSSLTPFVLNTPNINIQYSIDEGGGIEQREEDVNINIESVRASYQYAYTPCTYCVQLQPEVLDGPIENTPIAGRGVMTYHQLIDDEVTVLGQAGINTNLNYCFCGPGVFNVRPTLTIRAIPNCGGTSPIIFESIGEYEEFEVFEYKPTIALPIFDECCYPVNQEITLEPSEVTFGFGGEVDCEQLDILVTITNINTEEVVFSQNITHQSGDPIANLIMTFTPETTGIHRVNYEVTNCCTTINETFDIAICSDWIIRKTECNTVVIENKKNVTLNIGYLKLADTGLSMEAMTSTDISNLSEIQELPAFSSVVVEYPKDGLYAIVLQYEEELAQTYYFLLDCGIRECELKMLDRLLCQDIECCDVKEQQAQMFEWVTIRFLIDQWYGISQEFKDFQNAIVLDDIQGQYNSFADLQQRALKISELLKHIAKICQGCGIKICSDKIGCGKVVTTNVSSTNDCGCN